MVQDYCLWCSHVLSGMAAEESIRDVATCDLHLAQHQQLWAEIVAREETYDQAVAMGTELQRQDRQHAREVQDKMIGLQEVRDEMLGHWKRKQRKLEGTHLEQVFYRDTESIEKVTNSQEILLKNSDLGTTVDETEGLIKRHEAFEKLLGTQEDKISPLKDLAERLKKEDLSHEKASLIQGKLKTLLERRSRIKGLSTKRREELAISRQFCIFNRNAAEAEEWVSERMQKIQEDSKVDLSNLQIKMKLLQKHQVFEAEILAHNKIIDSVQLAGEELLSLRHPKSQEVRRSAAALQKHWEELKLAVAARGKVLEDNRDFLEFLQKVDQVEGWIRQKEVMINIGDVGTDYEHGLQLLRKLNEFRGSGSGEVTVDDAHIKAINNLAARLERQNSDDVGTVKQRRQQLNDRWNKFHGNLSIYKKKLESALVIHSLIRELDEVRERATEKINLLQGQDCGGDVESVENLKRRHEETEREAGVIQERGKALDKDAVSRLKPQSAMADKLSQKKKEVKTALVNLEKEVILRKERLEEAHQLQLFKANQRLLLDWTLKQSAEMGEKGLPKTKAEAEKLIVEHQDWKTEIDARAERIDSVRDFGLSLVKSGHSSSSDIKQFLTKLEEAKTGLSQAWQHRKKTLDQALSLQIFLGYLEQSESWLSNKEAFLANEDLGSSRSDVETLQRKHALFENTLDAQMEQVEVVDRFAQQLIQQKHFDSDNIKAKSKSVLLRKGKLLEMSKVRRKALEESLQLQKFLSSSYEVYSWLNERNAVALDESWREPINLQAKLLKHQSFEAEILANRNRVDTLTKEGERMRAAGLSNSEKIKLWLKDLNHGWEQLLNNCKEKKSRLQQAYQALQFQRSLDDMEEWLGSVEVEVANEDCGNDLPSVNRLLKALQDLEEVVDGNLERVQGLVDTAKDFSSKGNFLAKEIQQRVGQTVNRYNSLTEPMQNRRETLESWELLFQFYRDMDDEMVWIQEKSISASSKDWGTSLESTQSVVKKHQVVMHEIASRAPLVQAVQDAGQNLVRGRHFASHDISEKLAELKDIFEDLKRDSETRGRLLQDALKIQTFLSEVSELKQWMDKQRPTLESKDFGKSEEATEVFLRKLDSVDLDLENQQLKIESLQETGAKLEHCGHPNSHLVSKSLPEVLDEYESLRQLSASRRAALEDQLNLYVFEREARELQNWLCSRKTLAESEDYGQDLEDVEVLQKKFEDFVAEVNTLGQSKLNTVQQLGQEVKSTEGQRRQADLHQLWDDLIQNVKIRTENIKSAREVHQFDHDVDELKGWMSEKEVVLESDDQDRDLLSIQALIRQHEGLERDFVVIEEEVSRIKEEGRGLSRKYSHVRSNLSERLQEVEASWASLHAKAIQRRKRLGQAETVQKYLTEWTELMAWLKETLSLVKGEGSGGEGPDLEQLIKRHEEHRVQIDKQLQKSQALKDEGRDLIERGNFMSQELEDRVLELQELETQVQKIWEERRVFYQEELQILQLQRELEQAEHWLSTYEATLKAEEYGESVSDVLELMKKQEDLEAMIQAQSDRFNALQKKKAQRLQDLHGYDGESSSWTKLPRVTSLKRKPSDPKVIRSTFQKPPKPAERVSRTSPRSDVAPSTSISSSPSPSSDPRTLTIRPASGAPLAPSRSPRFAPPVNPPPSPPSSPRAKTRTTSHVRHHRLVASEEDLPPVGKPPIAPKPRLSFRESMSASLEVPTPEPPVSTPAQNAPEYASPESPLASSESAPASPVTHRSPSVSVSVPAEAPKEELSTPTEIPPPTIEVPPPPSSPLPHHTNHEDLPDGPPALSASPLDVKDQVTVTMDGMLEIKVKQAWNKGLENWEAVYAVLEKDTLNLFKDKQAAAERSSRWPPINMDGAVCKDNPYYRRKEHTFRLTLVDGSQYLFAASNREQQLKWVEELQNCSKSGSSSDSSDSGNLSKDTVDHKSKQVDISDASENIVGSRESFVSNESCETQRGPPPKPPHTYYNKHHYPPGGGTDHDGTEITKSLSSLQRSSSPTTTATQSPQSLIDTGTKDKTKNKSVFKKLFGK